MKKKLLLYISDGVGCRNFIYSKFVENASRNGFEVIILKNVSFTLELENCKIIEFPNYSMDFRVDLLKSAKNHAELYLFAKKFDRQIYYKYIFNNKTKGWKTKLKNAYVKWYIKKTTSERQLLQLEEQIYKIVRKTPICKKLAAILEIEKIDLIMFTNQRAVTNIPLIMAAEKQNILTVTNIFSWDNLPKATKIHKSDYFFVWSDYMAKELKQYYPHIGNDTIKVTGTPQFSSHINYEDILEREVFFNKYSLDHSVKYMFFTGDDVTTSPFDHIYLKDLCVAVEEINKELSNQFKVIFRRCPVDFSDRYDAIINAYCDIVTEIKPLWGTSEQENWQQAYPLKGDISLLKNLLFHSEVVINVGSTIAIDASFFNKVACYINYQLVESPDWQISDCYKFVHFDTLIGLKPIYWINSPDDYKQVINDLLTGNLKDTIEQAKLWAQKVILHPVNKVNDRIWNELSCIVKS